MKSGGLILYFLFVCLSVWHCLTLRSMLVCSLHSPCLSLKCWIYRHSSGPGPSHPLANLLKSCLLTKSRVVKRSRAWGHTAASLALERLTLENYHEFEASMVYRWRPCQYNQKKQDMDFCVNLVYFLWTCTCLVYFLDHGVFFGIFYGSIFCYL